MEIITQNRICEIAFELLVRTTTQYPKLFLDKLLDSLARETDPRGKGVLTSIINNISASATAGASLCQDTGVPTFHVWLNPSIAIKGDMGAAFIEATERATVEVPLRRNVVEPFRFVNPGTNTGWGTPFVYYHYLPEPGPMRIRAELKGFGGEIKSTSDWIFTNTPNMGDAVLSYVLNNVILSRGEGCAPGFIGVGLGGYLSEAAFNAKNAVFRELSHPAAADGQPDRDLRQLEERIFQSVNKLGIGPMGYGGNTSTLGVYLDKRGTHTAVAPVSVSHQCWASRGSEALVSEQSAQYITPHVDAEKAREIDARMEWELSDAKAKGQVYELDTPLSLETVRKLKVNDIVYLNGVICTSREGSHRRMVEKVKSGATRDIPEPILSNKVVFHCGPVIAPAGDKWNIVAAGPTSSSRFTTDAAYLIEKGIIRAAIGKGTMGDAVVNALKGRGVYLSAVGGCAVVYKQMIVDHDVTWLDLGYPEAVWVFTVKRFGPLVVSIDSHGNSLSRNLMETVYDNARAVYEEEGLDPSKRYAQYPQTFAGLSLEEVINKSKSM